MNKLEFDYETICDHVVDEWFRDEIPRGYTNGSLIIFKKDNGPFFSVLVHFDEDDMIKDESPFIATEVYPIEETKTIEVKITKWFNSKGENIAEE